jgi:hypothetical protein
LSKKKKNNNFNSLNLDLFDFLNFWEVKPLQKIIHFDFLFGKKKKYNGSPIYVQKAPEPQDILWENLGYTIWEIIQAKIWAWSFTFLLIIVCIALLIAISLGQVF